MQTIIKLMKEYDLLTGYSITIGFDADEIGSIDCPHTNQHHCFDGLAQAKAVIKDMMAKERSLRC